MLRRIAGVNGYILPLPELNKFIGRKVEITLKELFERKNKGKNLKKYFGILHPGGDALDFQKKMRAEWNERENPVRYKCHYLFPGRCSGTRCHNRRICPKH